MTGNLSQCPTLTLRREKYPYGEIYPEIHNGEVLSVEANNMQVGLFDSRKSKVVYPSQLGPRQARGNRHCDLDYLFISVTIIFLFFWKVTYMYLSSAFAHICFRELCNI